MKRELNAIRRRIRVLFLLGITGAVVLSPYAAQACSVCGGASIGTDPGLGFNTSLLFLMSMPYIVLGAIAGVLIYTYRRASGQQEKRKPIHHLDSIHKAE
jgi:hypothetical protein